MNHLFKALNKVLEKYIFVVILASMALGYLFAPVLIPLKWAVPYFFGFMTLSTAFGCSSKDFLGVLKNPVPITLILGLLHIVHPIFARFLGMVLHGAHNPNTVALVLGTAVPVGVTSVIWAEMLGANVPLALTAVTVDTLLAPFLVPLTVLVFAGRSVAFDVGSMMIGLVRMIVAPTIIGVMVNDMTRGRVNKWIKPYTSPLSKISLGFVVAINVAAAKGNMGAIAVGYPLILLGLALQCVFGYASGYYVSKWAGFDGGTSLTITYSAGIRNISAGIVIAMAYFPGRVAVPVVLSMLFQQPMATVTAKILARAGVMTRKSDGGVHNVGA